MGRGRRQNVISKEEHIALLNKIGLYHIEDAFERIESGSVDDPLWSDSYV